MIVEFSSTARKQLRKLDFQVQKKMKEYKDTLQSLENPRERGKTTSRKLEWLLEIPCW